MNKIFYIILINICLFSFSCKSEIDYLIENNSSFDVTVVDNSSLNRKEYFVKKNTSLSIKHYDSGNFSLKEAEYPVDILNYYTGTVINDKQTFDLYVKNLTNVNISFYIPNNYLEKNYSISPSAEKKIKIYVSPKIQTEHIYYSLNKNNDREYCLIFY